MRGVGVAAGWMNYNECYVREGVWKFGKYCVGQGGPAHRVEKRRGGPALKNLERGTPIHSAASSFVPLRHLFTVF